MPEEQLTMKEYLLERLNDLGKLQDERWKSHTKVHEMGQMAIDSSVKALDTRLEGMNQFRAQVLEERSAFVTQALYRSEYQAIEKSIRDLERFRNNMEGRIWMLVALFGVLQIVVIVVFHYWK
jgi:hypothetical protein